MRNLQKESDKATQAYKAAHDQLKIDQQGFHDYYESEKENLEELLGTSALGAHRREGQGEERTRTRRSRMR